MQPAKTFNFSSLPAATVGLGFAWLGVLVYAASNSIATLLVQIGEDNLVAGGRNAVTFANLLLLGSVISLVPMIAMFRKDWSRATLRALRLRDWALLQLAALLSSAVTPGLFFFALEHSSVTNVVLVSRIEPPLFLLAAAFFLKERIDPRAFATGMVALLGAMIMFGFRETSNHCIFGWGEIAAVGATVSYIASVIVARHALRTIPMGIFSIYRTAVGTVLYFVLISILQGPDTFQDVLHPMMLTWVWVYAVPVIVVGQLSWFFALKYARAEDMSLAASFSPLAGLFFAMLILGENPGPGFLPGATIILVAIALAQVKAPLLKKMRNAWRARPTFDTGDAARALVPTAAFPVALRPGYNGSY